MSGRGGIYKGPNGEQLYGDGREVNKPAEPSPEVAPILTGVCAHCGKSLKRAISSGKDFWFASEGGWSMFGCPVTKGLHSPVPAVAPRETQTELKCPPCPGDPKGTGFCEFHECERDCQTVEPYDATPAESQGVERAQPVEGPREDDAFTCSTCGCNHVMTWKQYCDAVRAGAMDGLPPAPVEGVERVTDDAPARVEPQGFAEAWMPGHVFRADRLNAAQPAKHTDPFMHQYSGEPESDDPTCRVCYRTDDLYHFKLAKHTDDRPAETIPDDLKELYDATKANQRPYSRDVVSIYDDRLLGIIERTGRAETRIEVLEAALRKISEIVYIEYDLKNNQVREIEATCDAALAAPSGEQK